jgi:hypothetical protein
MKRFIHGCARHLATLGEYIPKQPEDAGFGFVFFARKHRPSLAIGLAITRSRQCFLTKNTLPKNQHLQVVWVSIDSRYNLTV